MKMEVKVGDYVSLDTWFSDVWAEVMWVYGDHVTFVQYNKGGTERWTSSVMLGSKCISIREVSTTRPQHASVIYSDREYYGSFGRWALWPTSAREVNEKHLYTSNYRETIPQEKTDACILTDG